MIGKSARIWVEGSMGFEWVHFDEPYRTRSLWVSSSMEFIPQMCRGALKTQARELGIFDWLPDEDECVEIIITPKDDGVLSLGRICEEAAGLLGVEQSGSRFDAEYVCTWIPDTGGTP